LVHLLSISDICVDPFLFLSFWYLGGHQRENRSGKGEGGFIKYTNFFTIPNQTIPNQFSDLQSEYSKT
jgi:hypothetical protein